MGSSITELVNQIPFDSLNLIFFGIFGVIILGKILSGLFNGFTKTTYRFIRYTVFLVGFFLTVDLVANFLYDFNLSNYSEMISNFLAIPNTGITNIESIVKLYVKTNFAQYSDLVINNAALISLIAGIAKFVIKILYFILYFTVIRLLYIIITGIIRAIFVPKNNRKDVGMRSKSKQGLLGMVVGFVFGVVVCFNATIIMTSLMGILKTSSEVVDATNAISERYLEANDPSGNLIDPENVKEIRVGINAIKKISEIYEENKIIKFLNGITISVKEGKGDSAKQVTYQANEYLFDKVMSIDASGTKIAFRKELNNVLNALYDVTDSKFMETGEIKDLEDYTVTNVFYRLSDSNLINVLFPVAIETAAKYFEVDVDLKELYGVDWSKDFMRLGDIAGVFISEGLFVTFTDNNGSMIDMLADVTISNTASNKIVNSISKMELLNRSFEIAVAGALTTDEIKDALAKYDVEISASDFSNVKFGEELSKVVKIGLITLNNFDKAIEGEEFSFKLENSFYKVDVYKDIDTIVDELTSMDLLTIVLEKAAEYGQKLLNNKVPELEVSIADIVWATEVNNFGNILKSVASVEFDYTQAKDKNYLLNIVSVKNSQLQDVISSLFELQLIDKMIKSAVPYINKTYVPDEYKFILDDANVTKAGLEGDVIGLIIVAKDISDNGVIDLIENKEYLNLPSATLRTVISTIMDFSFISGREKVLIENLLALVKLDELEDISIPDNINYKNEMLLIVDIYDEVKKANIDLDNPTNIQNIEPKALENIFKTLGLSEILSSQGDQLIKLANKLISSDEEAISLKFPENVDWKNEFTVIGTILKDLITEAKKIENIDGSKKYIVFNDFLKEPTELIDIVVKIDTDNLCLSQVFSHTIVSLLSGKMIEFEGLEKIKVPYSETDSRWFSTKKIVDGEEIVTHLELSKLLKALKELLGIVDLEKLDEIDTSILNEISDEIADTLFSSLTIQATLSSIIEELDFEINGFGITIPDHVVDYAAEDTLISTIRLIKKSEFKNLVGAAKAIDLEALANDQNEPLEVLKDTTDQNIEKLFDSEIIRATISNALATFSTDGFEIVVVTEVEDEYGLIIKKEFVDLFKIIKLDVVNELMNPPVDEITGEEKAIIDILKDMEESEMYQIFDSMLIRASATKMIFDLDLGDDFNLLAPYSVNMDDTALEIRHVRNSEDIVLEKRYITKDEYVRLITAVKVLDLDLLKADQMDFIQSLNTDAYPDDDENNKTKANVILNSKILNASLGNTILTLDIDNFTLIIPKNLIINVKNQDDALVETISTAELDAIITGINQINIDNISDNDKMLDEVASLSKASTTDPTKTKINLILESQILAATIGGKIIELNVDGIDIIVPFAAITKIIDQNDNEKDTLLTEEITAIIIGVNQIDLDALSNTDDGNGGNPMLDEVKSLSGPSETNPGETKLEVLLKSKILAATIGRKIYLIDSDLDQATIIVPKEVVVNIETNKLISGTSEHLFVDIVNNDEVTNLIGALTYIDLNGELGMSTVKSLNDETSANSGIKKSEKVYQSKILKATISKVVLDMRTDASNPIIIPDEAIDSQEEHLLHNNDNTVIQTITNDEFNSVVSGIVYLDENKLNGTAILKDLNETVEIYKNVIDSRKRFARILVTVKKSSIVYNSLILQATISNKIIGMTNDGTIKISENYDYDILHINGEPTNMITREEFVNLVNAFAWLDINDLDNINGVTIIEKLQEDSIAPRKIADEVHDSIVISSTITDKAKSIATGSLVIIIPDSAKDENGNISAQELLKLSESISCLPKDDEDNLIFNGIETIKKLNEHTDPSNPSSPMKYDKIYESDILKATVSNEIIKLELDGTIVIPDNAYLNENYTTMTISPEEFSNLCEGLNHIDVDSFSDVSFDGIKMLKDLDAPSIVDDPSSTKKSAIVINSLILQCTISREIVKLDNDEDTIVIPSDAYTQMKFNLISKDVVTEDEFINLVSAINYLEVNDFKEASFDSVKMLEDLNKNIIEGDKLSPKRSEIIINSLILQCTISREIVKLDNDDTIIIPDDAYESKTIDGSETNIVSKKEFNDLVAGMAHINVNTLNGSETVKALNDPIEEGSTTTKASAVYNSLILKCTISREVVNISSLIIPDNAIEYLNVDSNPTKVITEDEFTKIVRGLKYLDVDTLNGSETVKALNEPIKEGSTVTKASVVYESDILKCTISKEIMGISSLAIPNEATISMNVDSVATKVITNEEFTLIVNGLNYIDVDGLNGMNTIKSLNDTSKGSRTKLDEIYDSLILSATISQEIRGLSEGTNPTIVIPNNAYVDGVYVDGIILKSEIANLVDGVKQLSTKETGELNLEGSSTIKTLNASAGIAYGDRTKAQVVYSSLILKASISKEIFNISSLIITTDAYTPYLVKDGSFNIIDEVEFNNLVVGMCQLDIDHLDGQTTINDLNLPSVDDPLKTKGQLVYESLILKATISDTIMGISNLITPDDVKVEKTNNLGSTVYVLTDTEFNALIRGINTIDFEDAGFGANSILLLEENEIDNLVSSRILQATISSKMKPVIASNGNLVYMSECEDQYGDISPEEIKRFTLGIQALGSSDIGTVELNITTIVEFDSVKQEKVISSLIFRATITKILVTNINAYNITAPLIGKEKITILESDYEYKKIDGNSEDCFSIDGTNRVISECKEKM